MFTQAQSDAVLKRYDTSRLSFATVGSHSALDICQGAKYIDCTINNRDSTAASKGFHTVVIAKDGREKTYNKYFRTRTRPGYAAPLGVVDTTIVVKEWKDIIGKDIYGRDVVSMLDILNAIMVIHRSSEVYMKHDLLESFPLPTFGNRSLYRAEERTGEQKLEKNQDFLAKEAGLPVPKRFDSPEDLDGNTLAIVKSNKAIGPRGFERDFPRIRTKTDYIDALNKSLQRASSPDERIAIEKSFKEAPIQEFIEGPQINLNFFYSKIWDELELLGTDKREQFPLPSGDEATHIYNSPRESLIEKAYDMGERFLAITKKYYPPGIIGPFSLQCIGDGSEKLRVIDISLR
ncbi:DUF1246 domain-containing protein, partial [archaeon]